MSDADEPLDVFEWAPVSAGLPLKGAAGQGAATHGAVTHGAVTHGAATHPGTEGLFDRVAPLAEDRGATAADLVRKVAREVHAWLIGADSPDAGVQDALARELAAVRDAHLWRAPVKHFLDALEAAADAVPGDAEAFARREAMAAECARWRGEDAGETPDRVRLGSKERCAAPLFDGPLGVTRGEVILVHGWSETVARGLELARARGLEPSAIVSEGGADLGGRRLARRLVAGGVPVAFVYDAALVSALERVDRFWIGSDAVGTRALLARIGTRAALERAADLDVDTAVLATSDKFLAEERPAPPGWAAEEPWHLWEGAPGSVTVESQTFEWVPLDLVRSFATEDGIWSAADVRARRFAHEHTPSGS